MIKVSSSQFNYRYFGRIHFPYSISLLVSYLKTSKRIRDYCKFEKKNLTENINYGNFNNLLKSIQYTDVMFSKKY